jgi:cytochrome b involved in lipid metabolism
MLVGVSALVISISILFYRHPPASWAFWPFAVTQPLGLLSDRKSLEPVRDSQPDKTVTADATQDLIVESKVDDASLPQRPVILGDPTLDAEIVPSSQTTPKANSVQTDSPQSIPSFSLQAHSSSAEDEDEDEDEDDGPAPSFPAINSAQRAAAISSAMGPPTLSPTVNRGRPSSSQLMAPPRLLATNIRALPASTNSLRIPSTGPLPNRGPALGSGLGPPPTAPIKTPNPRQKVLLTPGHSPLDWANLLKSDTNLSGVSSLIRVTPSHLKYNNGRKGRPAWSSYQGKVYNITPYLPYHPGGEGELRRAAGKDGGKLFMEVHPWVNWENMLGECLVGITIGEKEGPTYMGSLEDMD